MGTSSQFAQELNQVLRDLVTARDETRLRAHLLSLDARQRFGDIEVEIEGFERRLAARGEWVAEQVLATARGLTHALGELVAPRAVATPTRVRDVMTRNVATCQASDSLNRAAQLMWETDCGAVPVVDGQGKLVGIVTDRDVCMAAYTRGLPLAQLSVTAAMSRNVRHCKAEDSLRLAMDEMTKHQIRRIPVLADDGSLVGIVALADVARLAQAPSDESHEARIYVPGVLAGISEPSVNGRAAAAS
jgi:CBS domain-containing protein